MREDLQQCAYALALGFVPKLRHGEALKPEAFETYRGVPADGLQYESKDGRVHVWNTARGWRAARLNAEGFYPKAQDSDFSRHLFDALNKGAELMKAKD